MVLHMPLAVVILHAHFAGLVARRDDSAEVGDIAGFGHLDAQALVLGEGRLQLRLVNSDVPAGFMMTD